MPHDIRKPRQATHASFHATKTGLLTEAVLIWLLSSVDGHNCAVGEGDMHALQVPLLKQKNRLI